MAWKQLRLPVVGGFFLIFLSLAVAGQWVYEERWVWQPLAAEMARVPGVERVEVQRELRPPLIEVRLRAGVDLPQVYQQLETLASRRLGPADGGDLPGYMIAIADRRTPRLISAYNQLRLAVEEAIATGRFTELSDWVVRAKEEASLSRAELWVDRQNVYLYLQDGRGWLYAVIPRAPVPNQMGIAGMGDGGAARVET
ncbi:MAG: hypothetical protein IMX00_03210 [Limnochordales bacterium]|nr:hypothetical protein [Limnochordales bacterium]